jgi:hypothetical protein
MLGRSAAPSPPLANGDGCTLDMAEGFPTNVLRGGATANAREACRMTLGGEHILYAPAIALRALKVITLPATCRCGDEVHSSIERVSFPGGLDVLLSE